MDRGTTPDKSARSRPRLAKHGVRGNLDVVNGDPEGMACDQYVEAISAMIDGEEPAIERRLVERHLRSCAECAAFQQTSETVRRRLRVRPAVRQDDVSRRISTMTALADRTAAWRLPRALLVVVAVEVIVLSAVDLFAATGDGGAVHEARHLSAFTIAYGVLLLLVAVRPARARTALPVAVVLAAALAITAIADLVAHRVPLVGEALHIPEIVSVVLIWMLAVPGPHRRRRAARTPNPEPPARLPHLRAVERDVI